MNELKQIDIKLFADQGQDINPYEFVGVLQRWIQEHKVPGVLIDVADYSHIQDGAGVILVGHEYNLSVDYNDGRMGLLLHCKRPSEESLEARIASALKLVFGAAAALQEEDEFKTRLAFSRTNFRFLASDRLIAPNDDTTYSAIAPTLEQAAKTVSGADVTLSRVEEDAAARFAIDAVASADIEVGAPV